MYVCTPTFLDNKDARLRKLSYPDPFAPQPVYETNPLHPDPGAYHLQRTARPVRFVQPPAQKRVGLGKPF